jgi:hypothetical protein
VQARRALPTLAGVTLDGKIKLGRYSGLPGSSRFLEANSVQAREFLAVGDGVPGPVDPASGASRRPLPCRAGTATSSGVPFPRVRCTGPGLFGLYVPVENEAAWRRWRGTPSGEPGGPVGGLA